MEQTQGYLLEMEGVCKSFPGVKALDNAQLRLRAGTVHALMGENGAGKSTLMKCLFGLYKKDSGTIKMEGQEVNFADPRNALDNGVAMVHQELNQVLRRNVMENVWLGRFPMRAGLFVNGSKMYNETKRVFKELAIDVDPRTIIGKLSVSQRQMVEIAKAVSYNAKIVVLDEPTSSLTENEVEHLFRIIKKLTDQGVGIIYISHKMDEILRISDEVTIMRDGQWVATRDASALTNEEIIRLMVNREMSQRFPEKKNQPGEVLMEVKNLTGRYEPTCRDVSFNLHRGEVLGVAGLVVPLALKRALFRIQGKRYWGRHTHPERQPGRGHRQRFCPAHRGAQGHGHLPHGKHPVQLHHRQRAQVRQDAAERCGDAQGHQVGHRHHQRQDPEPVHGYPFFVGGEPAKGHHRALAAHRSRDPVAGRAHPGHRRGRQIRDLPIDPAAGGTGEGHHHGLQRNAGTHRHLRPHPGHVQRKDGGHRGAGQGLCRHTG